jgi:hypothetical protein
MGSTGKAVMAASSSPEAGQILFVAEGYTGILNRGEIKNHVRQV